MIDDPERVKILGDETRQRMICMLEKGSMSLSELARALSKTPATVFYHIRRLMSANLIKLEKTRIVNNNFVEKYYSLTFSSPCLIALGMSGLDRAPVPPRRLSRMTLRHGRVCPDICWDDIFVTLNLKLEGDRKKRLINIVNQIFEKVAFEAGLAFREATRQINMGFPSKDQRKFERLARAIPIMVFCEMLKKQENLSVLKDLLLLLRS